MVRPDFVDCSANKLARRDAELQVCIFIAKLFAGSVGPGTRGYCAHCKMFGRVAADRTVELQRLPFPRPQMELAWLEGPPKARALHAPKVRRDPFKELRQHR